jgi:hypothetical protein
MFPKLFSGIECVECSDRLQLDKLKYVKFQIIGLVNIHVCYVCLR